MTSSHYETSNPYLATFLLCCGAVLTSFTRVSARRFVFRFAANVRLHQLIRLWYSNMAVPLSPSGIFSSLHKLRSMVRGSPLYVTQDCGPTLPPTPASPTDRAEH